jgi:hypothetical protein
MIQRPINKQPEIMKSKFTFIVLMTALSLASPPVIESEAIIADSKGDMLSLKHILSSSQRDVALSHPEKLRIAFLVLIASNRYLATQQKPKDTPQINIAPPDGYRSGIDPTQIKDLAARKKYLEANESNKQLIELHNRWQAAIIVKTSATDYIRGDIRKDISVIKNPSIEPLWMLLPENIRNELKTPAKKTETNTEPRATGGLTTPK